ncbi:MAG: hypothetical protein DWH91_07180 [Planctomycetota bacterium]|nr:MAG: hypothetical protein DWH91_07180 [Planctomycetota bacterium]
MTHIRRDHRWFVGIRLRSHGFVVILSVLKRVRFWCLEKTDRNVGATDQWPGHSDLCLLKAESDSALTSLPHSSSTACE